MALLAKRISKNRLQLPSAIADRFPGVDLFEVSLEDERIVLRPAAARDADGIRRQLARRKIRAADAVDAVEWARAGRR